MDRAVVALRVGDRCCGVLDALSRTVDSMKRMFDFRYPISDRTSRSAHRKVLQRTAWFALVVLCVILVQPVARACPDCKEALFDPSQLQQKRSTAQGYAISIGMFLTVPAGLVGGLVTLVLKSRRH